VVDDVPPAFTPLTGARPDARILPAGSVFHCVAATVFNGLVGCFRDRRECERVRAADRRGGGPAAPACERHTSAACFTAHTAEGPTYGCATNLHDCMVTRQGQIEANRAQGLDPTRSEVSDCIEVR
jgi:hypothetical protein